MRAVVWEEPGKLAVNEVPDPTPGHGELIVKVGACGICGTDVHIADGEFPPTPYPIVPGHEFAGRVVALGEGVPGEWRGGERGVGGGRPRGWGGGGAGGGRPVAVLRPLPGLPRRPGQPVRQLERGR